MNIVAPEPPNDGSKTQGGSNTQNGSFPFKIAFHLKIVRYNVSLCEYCQQQRHSLHYLHVQEKWFVVNVSYTT